MKSNGCTTNDEVGNRLPDTPAKFQSIRALFIEAAKSPFSNPLLNWDCSYSCKTAVLYRLFTPTTSAASAAGTCTAHVGSPNPNSTTS